MEIADWNYRRPQCVSREKSATCRHETELQIHDWSIVKKAIASVATPCSKAGRDPGIHVKARGGRKAGYDNGVDQIRVIGDPVRVRVDDGGVPPYLGLCLKGACSEEGNGRPLCIHHVSAAHASDRGFGYHIFSEFVTPVRLSGYDAGAGTSRSRSTQELEDKMS